jgi:hypothetical protein
LLLAPLFLLLVLHLFSAAAAFQAVAEVGLFSGQVPDTFLLILQNFQLC